MESQTESTEPSIPAGRRTPSRHQPAPGLAADPLLDIARLHHIGVVVTDTDSAAAQFSAVWGMQIGILPESPYACRIGDIEHTVVQRIGMTIAGPPHLELLRTIAGTDVWESAGGVHHLGFVVEDVATASAELERRGAPLWMGGLRSGSCPAGTAYHRGPGGVTIEILDTVARDGLASRLATTTKETIS